MLEVLREALVATKPCESSPFHPAPRQDLEAYRGFGPLIDLDRPFTDLAQWLTKLFTGISTIGEPVPQPRVAVDDHRQHNRCVVANLHVGGADYSMNQIANGVGQDVALAPFGLLAGIISPRPAGSCGIDIQTVDHTRAGLSFAPEGFPADKQQGVIERQSKVVVSPEIKPAPQRRDGGIYGGNIRHGKPPHSRYKVASMMRRSGHLSSRPTY